MRINFRQLILLSITLSSLLVAQIVLKEHVSPSYNSQHSATTKLAPPPTTTVLSNNPNSSDWTIDSPVWSLTNGFLDGSGLSYPSPKIISSSVFSSDRTVELDFRTVTSGDQPWYTAWIVGKYTDFYDKAVLIQFSTGGLQLSVSGSEGGVVHYYSANQTFATNQWHHAKIIFAGNTTTVYMNGTLAIKATDPLIGALGDSAVSLASWGNSESQFNKVTVTASVLPDEPPVASFYYSPDPPSARQLVSFNGYPSYDPDGSITSYSWNFGDGSNSSGVSPSHTYSSPGNYTVTLTVMDSSGLTAKQSQTVTVLPPPTITATPSSGAVGTRVTVHGSGFPIQTQPYVTSVTVDVTFDDQFVGFETITSSSFDFTFNVPLSQPGLHQIDVYAQTYPAPIEASTAFTVTPQPAANGLSLTVTMAALYFPGDTATVYVLSTLNGSPTQAQTIQLSLIPPTGTATSVTLTYLGLGLYKGTYTIPTTGSIGTYALVALSQVNHTNATALASFEVKLSWLQGNGKTLATGAGIVGAIGTVSVLGVMWKKQYSAKKRKEEIL